MNRGKGKNVTKMEDEMSNIESVKKKMEKEAG